MKKSNHAKHVHVMTKLHEIEVMRQARMGIRETIDEAIEDLQLAYDYQMRDQIGQQISILYTMYDALDLGIKQSNYIWN